MLNGYLMKIYNFLTHSLKFVYLFHSKNVKVKMYKTIILPVVLLGCETWSLILR
jgi:hypothetical protein